MSEETDAAIGVTVIFGLIGMMLGGAGALIMRYHRKRQQTIRDRRALFILKKLEAGEALDFSLYLRAFATTGSCRRRQITIRMKRATARCSTTWKKRWPRRWSRRRRWWR